MATTCLGRAANILGLSWARGCLGSLGGRATLEGGRPALGGGRATKEMAGHHAPSPSGFLLASLPIFCTFFRYFGHDMLLHPIFVYNSWNQLVILEILINYALKHEMLVVEICFIDRRHPPHIDLCSSSSKEKS